jgi:uncharacterized protein
MKKLSEIRAYLTRQKQYLQRYGITEIGLFGSYIRDSANDQSDIDILIDIKRPSKIGLLELLEIEEMLSSDLNTKVDLVIKSDLKPAIGAQILREVQYI